MTNDDKYRCPPTGYTKEQLALIHKGEVRVEMICEECAGEGRVLRSTSQGPEWTNYWVACEADGCDNGSVWEWHEAPPMREPSVRFADYLTDHSRWVPR